MSKTPIFDVDVYPPFEGFPKEGIDFFKKLKRNNHREWFEKHKQEYEEHVKLPMQCLVASLQPHFARFAPEYELNPKRAIFRIYRDVRFSKDKTPYKTHVAAHFVLRGKPKGLLGSGYYLAIEPGESFVGAGIYMPDGEQLKRIRKAIAGQASKFLGVINDKKFKKRFGTIEGDKLKRIPQGYEENHPMAEWLKLKQFFVGVSWPDTKSLRSTFVEDLVAVCEDATPLVRFLNKAIL